MHYTKTTISAKAGNFISSEKKRAVLFHDIKRSCETNTETCKKRHTRQSSLERRQIERREKKNHLPGLPCEIQRIASVSEAVAMTFDYRTVARGENFV